MINMIKALVIFGAGLYTGVYVAQNYKDAMSGICKRTIDECDRVTKKCFSTWVNVGSAWHDSTSLAGLKKHVMKSTNPTQQRFHFIDKVEDPKVLFEKAQSYLTSKLTEYSDNGKKGDK